MFHPQGPHPVEDTFRMMTAVVMLDHSLNGGINAATLQFNTIHKTWSSMSNYERTTAPEMWHAALDGYKKGEGWDSLTPQCIACGLIVSLWVAMSEW
jgi:hypothetical protein